MEKADKQKIPKTYKPDYSYDDPCKAIGPEPRERCLKSKIAEQDKPPRFAIFDFLQNS